MDKKGKKFIGPPTWTLIHSLAASYDPSQSSAFKSFMISLVTLFPCEVCRKNLKDKLTSKIPLDNYLGSKEDLFLWTYIIHDMVNQHINEYHPEKTPKVSPPYIEIRDFYFDKIGDECKECKI